MNNLVTVPNETIISKIYLIRGKKVMFDKDLAEIYKVQTKDLNKSVKRNRERFPEDFMFTLNKLEFENLRFQFGTSSSAHGGRRYMPMAFTEQGVAMLSSVLRSSRAVQVNIQIIRTFTKLREILSENKKLAEKIEKMELKYDSHILKIFGVLKQLTAKGKVNEEKPKERMGFVVPR